jgi:dipeptidase E
MWTPDALFPPSPETISMRLLLGSGGFRTPERIAFLTGQMHALFGGIDRVLFVPYALADHDSYLAMMHQRGLDAGYRLVGIHTLADPVAAVKEAPALYIGGGNTFRLLAELYRRDLLEPIRQRVLASMPYLGVSAGSNVACPTIKTTNDMPITWPPSLDALGLVRFQINPHYFTGQPHVKREDGGYHEHFGETRDERLAEFHQMNETPVVGLWEAGTLSVENGQITLAGAPARIFRKGQPFVDVEPPTRLEGLLAQTGLRIAYTVAVTFTDPALAESWLAWLHGGHLAQVVAAGALDSEVTELEAAQGRSFEVRYHFASREAFEHYQREHAPRLREEGLRLFPSEKGVGYRRTVGVVARR